MVQDYTAMTDNELSARMAERIGFRFEANDGGTAFRFVDLELEKAPWRSTMEEAWRDGPNFIETLWLWDQPELLIPLGKHAWEYWRALNDLHDSADETTQRDRVIAFLMSVPPSPRIWAF
jgi:hypothetical protein